MLLNFDNKKQVIKYYCNNKKNIGCTEIQIILLTFRINKLQNHFLNYKKDFHSKKGLLKLVFKRRKLLHYLKINNINKYENLLKKIKIRR